MAQEQDQQKAYIILNGNFFCLPRPSETFALHHFGFVPREWLAAICYLGMLCNRRINPTVAHRE